MSLKGGFACLELWLSGLISDLEWTSLQPGGGGGECIAGKRNISNSINILYQSFGGLYVLLR